MSQGSVAASSDNDWGSDFDDATEAVKDSAEAAKNMKVIKEDVFSLISLNLPRFLHLKPALTQARQGRM